MIFYAIVKQKIKGIVDEIYLSFSRISLYGM
jgi:hypothetical protein